MYELLYECLEATLNRTEFSDIVEEASWTGSWDQETRTKAQGLLTSLASSYAIITLMVIKNVLENVRLMASMLQKRWRYSYGWPNQGTTVTNIMMRHQEIEEEYSVWYKDATRLGTLLRPTISAPRTPRSFRQIQRAIVPRTTPREHYLHNLTIPICDHLSAEIHNRFNLENRNCTNILALLCSGSQTCQTYIHCEQRWRNGSASGEQRSPQIDRLRLTLLNGSCS